MRFHSSMLMPRHGPSSVRNENGAACLVPTIHVRPAKRSSSNAPIGGASAGSVTTGSSLGDWTAAARAAGASARIAAGARTAAGARIAASARISVANRRTRARVRQGRPEVSFGVVECKRGLRGIEKSMREKNTGA